MKNEKTTTAKTDYQQLLEKLDDADFARQFSDEKQKEIEEMIADILMVTSGVSNVPFSGQAQEWGHESLFKIFDILMIRHENFHTRGILENLQHFLFSWTMNHSDAYRFWSNELEARSDVGDARETPEQTEQTDELNKLAAQISEVMKSPLLPERLYNVLSDEMTKNPFDTDSKEWILANINNQKGEKNNEKQ